MSGPVFCSVNIGDFPWTIRPSYYRVPTGPPMPSCLNCPQHPSFPIPLTTLLFFVERDSAFCLPVLSPSTPSCCISYERRPVSFHLSRPNPLDRSTHVSPNLFFPSHRPFFLTQYCFHHTHESVDTIPFLPPPGSSLFLNESALTLP